MQQEFNDTVRFFGEDPAHQNPEEFFNIFKIFLTNFEKATADNKAEKERELAQEKKRKIDEEKARQKKEQQTQLGVPDLTESKII